MVNVVGLGYIGLPTALMLASHGVEVVGTDYNSSLVDKLNNGCTTFQEDGLDELFQNALSGEITFSTEYHPADIYIISVPTPYDKESKKIDPSYVISAVESVLNICPDNAIVVIESTVSPGTIDQYVRPLIKERAGETGKKIFLAHAPERIIPGNMVFELLHNNRTIGADDLQTAEKVKRLYSSFCDGDIILTDIRSAEMSKVVENTFRDINIAFANELMKICNSAGMDVYEIIRLANNHPRVNILSPGPGVGGHCISVDPWFLVGDYPELARLIRNARETNDSMPGYVLKRTREMLDENGLTDLSRVGVYGLTYKENVDDTRESPTLQLLDRMKDSLSSIECRFYDPWVERDIVPNQVHSLDDFLDGLDAVVVMVAHGEIRENMDRFSEKIVMDTRHVFPDSDNVYRL